MHFRRIKGDLDAHTIFKLDLAAHGRAFDDSECRRLRPNLIDDIKALFLRATCFLKAGGDQCGFRLVLFICGVYHRTALSASLHWLSGPFLVVCSVGTRGGV